MSAPPQTPPTRRAVLAASAGLVLAATSEAFASPADLIIANGVARFGRSRYKCAVGYGGIRADKKEGDGATPAGSWPIRHVLFRPDRVRIPKMKFDVRDLKPNDGWCDAPSDLNYNRPVQLPYAASAEALWRKDGIYDVIAVLGYNDDPVVPGRGSAIFLHIARANYSPTVGCVALARENLLVFLSKATPATRVVIRR
ncbi:MAG: L,D-transpeptidase family protein [Alphaproteobacteria bacterium]|nr:L,D-transpeptidase family protein [Alphaproteobacteria bacterium]